MDLSLFLPVVEGLLHYILLAVVLVLSYYARQGLVAGVDYLKVHVGVKRYGQLKELAGLQVKALEQSSVFKELTGPEKKEQALYLIKQFASKHGLPLDEEFIDNAIEAAVHEMNSVLKGSLD